MNSKIVVIKYGGAAMETPVFMQATMQNIVHLKSLGIDPVIVHGGGPEISKMCQIMGVNPVFVNGLRVTDNQTLEIAQMVLVGKINKELVSQLNQEGGTAVGLSGHDSNLILAKQANASLGFVGEIEKVNPEILTILIQAGFIPVIAPIAISKESQSYNINADSVAAAIAIALNADHLIFLTDVAGVLKDSGTKIDIIKAVEIDDMIENGHVQGGMIPKMEAAFTAIHRGVNQVHILDGRVPNVLLLHFHGNETKGTAIYGGSCKTPSMPNTEQIIELDKKYLMNTYNRYPIAIVKGEGIKVWDADGKEYLDFLGGIAVNVLGHCHAQVVDAIIAQVKELVHISNLYYTKPAVELAELLALNGGLNKIFFCNSGAEANEGAIKLSRKYQWRKGHQEKYKVITASHSFHGRTLATLAATHKPEIQEGFAPLPCGFQAIEWSDTQSFLESIDETTAAVLLEPIQGEGGIHCATRDFLEKVRVTCNRVGALLIFDEIQCGMGRCGTLFAYESFGVTPDIITLAKGIASGLPLGAICATDAVAEAFHPGDHGTTFGANPVATTAALATLKILLAENYPKKVTEIGHFLVGKLHQLQKKYPQAIAEVRGLGLMIGIELKTDANLVLQKCHSKGLLVNITAGNVLRLLPAYTITEKDIECAIAIIEEAIFSCTTNV